MPPKHHRQQQYQLIKVSSIHSYERVRSNEVIPPVIYEASSLIKNASAFAHSSTVPILFIIVPAAMTFGSTNPAAIALSKFSPLWIGPLFVHQPCLFHASNPQKKAGKETRELTA
jgi:hypothetical protein